MRIASKVTLSFCLISFAIAAENSGELFSGLFKAIANALISSGVSRQQQNIHSTEFGGITTSVYNALQSISKNDELECVPRLLCEAVAGGKFGGSRELNIDKYSLSKLISYLQLDPINSSPILAFGKAIVLGFSNRGDPYSCIINYPKCPKDQNRLLYYLNNHRGGFFRFFDVQLPHKNYYEQIQYGQNVYYPQYNSDYYNKYKHNDYSYGIDNYLNGKKGKRLNNELYAKKYKHGEVSFPETLNHKNPKKVSFPNLTEEPSEEPRIVTKPTTWINNNINTARPNENSFVFTNSQRYGKKVKDFFPSHINAVTKAEYFVSDRLPSSFSFPYRDHSRDSTAKGLAFPKTK